MPKPKIVSMRESEVQSMRLTSYNRVLIKIHEKNVERKTASGIIMIAATDTSWHPDFHADRIGTVIQAPLSLKKERNHLWKTEVEILPNDIVFFDPMIGENCDQIITEEFTYYLLDYFSLHLVRREDKAIMLNGYCLFDLVSESSNSPLSINSNKKDARLGIMRYQGSVNKYYYSEVIDDCRLSEGDLCVFKVPPVMLESSYHARFENSKEYRISQRYNICGFIRDGKLMATLNHIIIEPEMPSETAMGIVIPESYRKPNGFGTVYNSGYFEVLDGERVFYEPNAAVKIEHEGKKLHIIHFNNLYYRL